MVKSKQAQKKPQPPAAKRPKTTHKPAASMRSAVDPTKLAWSTVHLPSEAQSGGAGQTESDFFSTLNWDDDDFMGLQEIDDVDVVQEARPDGSRTISFLASDKKLKSKSNKPAPASSSSAPPAEPETTQKKAKKAKKSNKKRSIDQVASESEPEAAPEPASPVHADESVADLEDAESDAYETAADQTIAEQDVDSDLDDDDLAEAFRNAHSLDLHDDEDDDEFDDSSLPAWSHLPLHAALKRALAHKGFQNPTEIQNRSIPLALGLQQDASSDSDEPSTSSSAAFKKRDVVGVSQTGSGKTLAYGLPILNYLFHNAENVASAPSHGDVPPPLGALIVCPTRELALQVSAHLTDVIRSSCLVDGALSYAKLVRRPQIAVVCGGMSEHKQRRLLQGRSRRAGVDIIVATPGRLWEMTRLDDELAARIKQVRFLVLDEADRMVQVGHFAEMEHILNLVHRAEAQRPKEGQDGQQSDSDGESGAAVVGEGVRPNAAMQTFVFSATLSKALQTNLKRRRKMPQFTKKRHSKKSAGSTFEELLERIDFRSSPAIVDLTPAQGLPSGLMETKLECVSKDKDAYLYYFLLRYPGRSLVFVNSIDGIRRLSPILAQLGLVCYPIHSQLQQKQRLKNLDRFRSAASNCILLATDVAARGLDIPSVDHVVHYQLPRSADTYIHRSGRTARAGTSGVSLALIEPREKTLWVQLSRALSRPDPPSFPITFSTLALLRERVELAIAIDKQMHAATKQAHDDSWLAQLALDADLAVSDDDLDPDAPTSSSRGGSNNKNAAKLAEMRARLARLLAKPVTMVGVSHRYLTATGLQGSAWIDEMLQQKAHKHIVGEKNTDAQAELEARKPDKQQAKKAKRSDAPAEIVGAKKTPAQQAVKKAKKPQNTEGSADSASKKQPGKNGKKPKVKQGAK